MKNADNLLTPGTNMKNNQILHIAFILFASKLYHTNTTVLHCNARTDLQGPNITHLHTHFMIWKIWTIYHVVTCNVNKL